MGAPILKFHRELEDAGLRGDAAQFQPGQLRLRSGIAADNCGAQCDDLVHVRWRRNILCELAQRNNAQVNHWNRDRDVYRASIEGINLKRDLIVAFACVNVSDGGSVILDGAVTEIP